MAISARAMTVPSPTPARGKVGFGARFERMAVVLAMGALLAALGATWFAVSAGTDYPEPLAEVAR